MLSAMRIDPDLDKPEPGLPFERSFGLVDGPLDPAIAFYTNDRIAFIQLDIVLPFFIRDHKELGPKGATLLADNRVLNKWNTAFFVE